MPPPPSKSDADRDVVDTDQLHRVVDVVGEVLTRWRSDVSRLDLLTIALAEHGLSFASKPPASRLRIAPKPPTSGQADLFAQRGDRGVALRRRPSRTLPSATHLDHAAVLLHAPAAARRRGSGCGRRPRVDSRVRRDHRSHGDRARRRIIVRLRRVRDVHHDADADSARRRRCSAQLAQATVQRFGRGVRIARAGCAGCARCSCSAHPARWNSAMQAPGRSPIG